MAVFFPSYIYPVNNFHPRHMFQYSEIPFGPHRCYTLSDEISGNRFSIVPGKGANVLNLYFNGVNILDGYETPEELEAAKWGKSVLLFPFPNRLDHGLYTWEGKTYQFPLNNAATENAIHGFVREEAFEVVKIDLAEDKASIICRFQYGGERPYYPFPFVLDVEFTIQNGGIFEVKTTCKNLHNAPIPFGFGWHPYFRLTEKAGDHQMQLPDCEMVEINERMIPTGKRSDFSDFTVKKPVGDTFLDNCFAALTPGEYSLTLEAAGKSIQVQADSQTFPFFQVFTPPHRQSIALEPMSCNVDALNNGQGLVSLPAGETWQGRMKILMINNER